MNQVPDLHVTRMWLQLASRTSSKEESERRIGWVRFCDSFGKINKLLTLAKTLPKIIDWDNELNVLPNQAMQLDITEASEDQMHCRKGEHLVTLKWHLCNYISIAYDWYRIVIVISLANGTDRAIQIQYYWIWRGSKWRVINIIGYIVLRRLEKMLQGWFSMEVQLIGM